MKRARCRQSSRRKSLPAASEPRLPCWPPSYASTVDRLERVEGRRSAWPTLASFTALSGKSRGIEPRLSLPTPRPSILGGEACRSGRCEVLVKSSDDDERRVVRCLACPWGSNDRRSGLSPRRPIAGPSAPLSGISALRVLGGSASVGVGWIAWLPITAPSVQRARDPRCARNRKAHR